MIVWLVLGFALGVTVTLLFRIGRGRTAREIAEEMLREKEKDRRADMEAVMENLKVVFGNLSLEALSRSTEEFLKLARSGFLAERDTNIRELEARKGLIDQQLVKMTGELDNIGKLMKELEKDRAEKFGELAKHLRVAGEQTNLLLQTTGLLREALAGAKTRGQWGERMAEDILRAAGFVENVNYVKQATIEGVGSRPDFTFMLPKGFKLNMDVKFPFDNYLRYLEAGSDLERARHRTDFLRDVRAKIREVTGRDYINGEQNTVDYALLFIPNERVYGFIHEQDSDILEEGIKQRVICCSPATLFAVLAVVRQAVDSFGVERMSNEILSLLGAFKKQWDEFLKKLELMGRRIDDLQKEFESLNSTRRRQLEKPLRRIEEIRAERLLSPAESSLSACERSLSPTERLLSSSDSGPDAGEAAE
jgi:DNA recombination protein RmuC